MGGCYIEEPSTRKKTKLKKKRKRNRISKMGVKRILVANKESKQPVRVTNVQPKLEVSQMKYGGIRGRKKKKKREKQRGHKSLIQSAQKPMWGKLQGDQKRAVDQGGKVTASGTTTQKRGLGQLTGGGGAQGWTRVLHGGGGSQRRPIKRERKNAIIAAFSNSDKTSEKKTR